jgi:O-antigen/teichoic acid export membrane protein
LVARVWGTPGGPEEVQRFISRLIIIGLGVSLPVTIMTFIFAPEVIHFVLGPEYAGAILPTRILVWFLPLAVVGAPLLAALAGSGHAGDTTKVFAVAFGVAMIIHLSLDWWWGATGAAVASLAREPAAMLLAFLLARRVGILPSATDRTPASVVAASSEAAR